MLTGVRTLCGPGILDAGFERGKPVEVYLTGLVLPMLGFSGSVV